MTFHTTVPKAMARAVQEFDEAEIERLAVILADGPISDVAAALAGVATLATFSTVGPLAIGVATVSAGTTKAAVKFGLGAIIEAVF